MQPKYDIMVNHKMTNGQTISHSHHVTFWGLCGPEFIVFGLSTTTAVRWRHTEPILANHTLFTVNIINLMVFASYYLPKGSKRSKAVSSNQLGLFWIGRNRARVSKLIPEPSQSQLFFNIIISPSLPFTHIY
jgi:hypothetical protein